MTELKVTAGNMGLLRATFFLVCCGIFLFMVSLSGMDRIEADGVSDGVGVLINLSIVFGFLFGAAVIYRWADKMIRETKQKQERKEKIMAVFRRVYCLQS